MKRRYKTIIGIVVLCVVLASIVGVIFSRESDQELLEKQLTEEDFLETDGQKIVNQNGDEILLRGTNLGGWLIQEYWMCPVAGDSNIEQWSNSETLTVLENRFGKEQTQELIETYQDNWITEKDIKQSVIFVTVRNIQMEQSVNLVNFLRSTENSLLCLVKRSKQKLPCSKQNCDCDHSDETVQRR